MHILHTGPISVSKSTRHLKSSTWLTQTTAPQCGLVFTESIAKKSASHAQWAPVCTPQKGPIIKLQKWLKVLSKYKWSCLRDHKGNNEVRGMAKQIYIHYINWLRPSPRLARSCYLLRPKSFKLPFPGSWEETICGHTAPSILALSCWKTLTHTSWHWPEGHFCFSYLWWRQNTEVIPWLQETPTGNRTDPSWEITRYNSPHAHDAGSQALTKDFPWELDFKWNTFLLCM